jgi:hypothetical protein
MGKINKVDSVLGKMTLEELLRLYDEGLTRYASKTAATRRSILKIFKETCEPGLDLPLKTVSAGQIELGISCRLDFLPKNIRLIVVGKSKGELFTIIAARHLTS